MRKKRRSYEDEQDERSDRWVVSYADFITLLFAFFTTLYAISRVDLGKLERFSGSMRTAFTRDARGVASAFPPTGGAAADYAESALENSMGKLLRDSGIIQGISMTRDERGVSLVIEDSLLFNFASAELKPEARPVLDAVAALARETERTLVVEGHTDSIPVRSGRYGSNWELSSARATCALVFLVQRCGLRPERLSAAGYGEYRPVATNATPAGRAKNRRVEIIFVGPQNQTYRRE